MRVNRWGTGREREVEGIVFPTLFGIKLENDGNSHWMDWNRGKIWLELHHRSYGLQNFPGTLCEPWIIHFYGFGIRAWNKSGQNRIPLPSPFPLSPHFWEAAEALVKGQEKNMNSDGSDILMITVSTNYSETNQLCFRLFFRTQFTKFEDGNIKMKVRVCLQYLLHYLY